MQFKIFCFPICSF